MSLYKKDFYREKLDDAYQKQHNLTKYSMFNSNLKLFMFFSG